MKYLCDSLFLLFLLLSCNNKSTNEIIHSYSLTIEDTYRESSLLSFFDSISLVQLETNEKSLINYIYKIREFDEKLFLWDISEESILIFGKKGNYINKVNNRGQGPEEYIRISDFEINKINKELEIIDPVNNLLISYDLNGIFKQKKKLPLLNSTYDQFLHPDSLFFIFWTQDKDNQLKVLRNEKQCFTFQGFPRISYSRNAFLFSDSLFLKELSDEIYVVKDNEVKLKYKITVNNYLPDLKTKKLPNSYDMNSQINFLKKINSSEIVDYKINSINESTDYIVLNIIRKNKIYFSLIDKKNGKSTTLSNSKEGILPIPLFMNNTYCIAVLTPENREYNGSLFEIISKEDQIILKKFSEENNPILIYFYFKK